MIREEELNDVREAGLRDNPVNQDKDDNSAVFDSGKGPMFAKVVIRRTQSYKKPNDNGVVNSYVNGGHKHAESGTTSECFSDSEEHLNNALRSNSCLNVSQGTKDSGSSKVTPNGFNTLSSIDDFRKKLRINASKSDNSGNSSPRGSNNNKYNRIHSLGNLDAFFTDSSEPMDSRKNRHSKTLKSRSSLVKTMSLDEEDCDSSGSGTNSEKFFSKLKKSASFKDLFTSGGAKSNKGKGKIFLIYFWCYKFITLLQTERVGFYT